MGIIVFSGANITTGGPLEIYKNILSFTEHKYPNTRILAIVNSKELFGKDFKNVDFIEIRNYKNYIFLKFYYEYIRFHSISKNRDIDLWLSLNDCTPTVRAKIRAVYCHNATPFYKRTLQDYLNPTIAFFQSFYYFLFYRVNLKKNNFIIVQQQWIKDFFVSRFSIKRDKIIVNHILNKQKVCKEDAFLNEVSSKSPVFQFLYPTKAQPYKNLEVILKAVELLEKKSDINFRVILTISGKENKYSKKIYDKYKHLKSIEWKGFVSRDELEILYLNSHCLIFSSKLETWGLPISEFKAFQKPMLIADLPYARETVGDYLFGKFFHPDNAFELSNFMKKLINKTLAFDQCRARRIEPPYAVGFEQLFNILLFDCAVIL